MKKFNLLFIAMILLAVITSCKDVTGMWIDEFSEDNSDAEVWLTLDEDGAFEYVTLSSPYTIDVFYKGTYSVDSAASTITFKAEKSTDGAKLENKSEYDWVESTWTAVADYEFIGSDMKISIDSVVITLSEREQPIELMRSLAENDLETLK